MFAALGMQDQNKNYITRVFDFLPAPGQFVNDSPKFTAGEPRDSVLARALKSLGPKIEVLIDYIEDSTPAEADEVIDAVLQHEDVLLDYVVKFAKDNRPLALSLVKAFFASAT